MERWYVGFGPISPSSRVILDTSLSLLALTWFSICEMGIVTSQEVYMCLTQFWPTENFTPSLCPHFYCSVNYSASATLDPQEELCTLDELEFRFSCPPLLSSMAAWMTELQGQEDNGCPWVLESRAGKEGDSSALKSALLSSQPVCFDGKDLGNSESTSDQPDQCNVFISS